MSISTKTRIVVRPGDVMEFKSIEHRYRWSWRCKQNEEMNPFVTDRFKVLEMSGDAITMIPGLSSWSYHYDNKYDEDDDVNYQGITRVLDSGEIVDRSHPLFETGEPATRTVYRSSRNATIFTTLEVQMYLQHTVPAEGWVQDMDICSMYMNPTVSMDMIHDAANDDSYVPESFKKIIKEKKAKTPRGVKEQISIHINKTIGSDKGAQELINYIRSKFKVQ